MSESGKETDRAAITTYVPAFQKEEWETDADELEMSQSEFVRTMVQAGRRGFGDTEPDEPDSPGSNPRGNVRETVLQTLETNGDLTWEELFEKVANDLESKLENTVIELQEEGKITHKPRNGTYTLIEEQ
ncbi:MAG: DUF5805 domain-containing protein [Halodesulfurarchaeum sp.]|nr:DUF5805 domain-containing protein [Halodesulfurarchaeum sp.]